MHQHSRVIQNQDDNVSETVVIFPSQPTLGLGGKVAPKFIAITTTDPVREGRGSLDMLWPTEELALDRPMCVLWVTLLPGERRPAGLPWVTRIRSPPLMRE